MTEDALEGKVFPFGHFYNSNILYQVYQTKRGHERIKIICMVRTYDSLKWLNIDNIIFNACIIF